MTDLFGGPTKKDLQDSHVHHSTVFLALAKLLIDKGIITDEEYTKSYAKAIAIMDQIVAEKREEVDKKFKEEHPELAEFLPKVFGGGLND